MLAPTAAALDVTPQPAYDLTRWRRQVPVLSSYIPLNNCTQAPQTVATRAAIDSYLDSWNRLGTDWDVWLEEIRLAKIEFARLIGATPEEIAVVDSLSGAVTRVASALDFGGERNRVVVSGAEFPTVAHAWLAQRRYGAEIDWVPLQDDIVPADSYAGRIDDRTRVVSACHAYYQNGYLQDLRTIAEQAHRNGALLFVDAYQTIGVHSVDVKALNVDFLAAGNLKFLMGIPGIAFLYVRCELIETLEPSMTGWFGRAKPFEFKLEPLDWSSTANRFETGTPGIAAAYAARAGMAMLNEIGLPAIETWCDYLSGLLVAGGEARGFTVHGCRATEHKTPLTAFVCPTDSDAVEAALRGAGFLASARGPAIRLAPHFYNTPEDIELALDALARIFQEAGPR